MSNSSRPIKLGQLENAINSTTQAALDLKSPKASPVFTGSITIGSTAFTEDLIKLNNATLSTGAYQFSSGGITSASTTTFNVGAVKGWIVNSSDPLNASPVFVNYPGGTGLTTPYIASASASYLMINNASGLSIINTRPTVTQRRDNIYLGVIGHPAGTITGIGNAPDIIMNVMSQVREMFEPLRFINGGITCYPNSTNLTIANTAGTLYGLGIGFITNGNNAPSILSVAAGTPTTLQYRTRGTATFANTTVADPGFYDLAGARTAIGGSPNQATNQRIYLLENGSIRIQYGQSIYSTLTNAIAATQTETFVTNVNATNLGILIGILSIQSGCTNLSDANTARFLAVSKFGESIGASAGISTGTLQSAYNNSLVPQIQPTDALGAFTIKSARSSNASNIQEWQNIAGTLTAWMNGNGELTAQKLIKQGGLSTEYLMADGSVSAGVSGVDTTALHKTGDESFTGMKSSTVNGTTALNLTNIGNAYAVYGSNSSTGRFMYVDNNSTTNEGIYVNNTSTGRGFYSKNSGTGAGIHSENNTTGYGTYIDNVSTGTGLFVKNNAAGVGISMLNISNANGFFSENQSSGNGIYTRNVAGGTGIFSENQTTGDGIRTYNTLGGRGIYSSNFASGDGIVSNGTTASTGKLYVGQNNGATTFSVNKLGNVVASSFSIGGSNTEYLMADGSVTTGGGGGGGTGTVTNVSATLGTTGTNLSISVANSTTTPAITLNVPTASASNRGALSSSDWSTFNNKQIALVSGTNIKSINSNSLLGSGNLTTIDLGAIKRSGGDTFTGLISATNSGATSTNGFNLTSSGDSGTSVLNITNTLGGSGQHINNTSYGTGLLVDNPHYGVGIYVSNSAITDTTGIGIAVDNAAGSGGYGIGMSNYSASFGLYSYNPNGGAGIRSDNTGTGVGINASTSSSGPSMMSTSSSSDNALFINSSTAGVNAAAVYGEVNSNANSNFCFQAQVNGSKGSGLKAFSTTTTESLVTVNNGNTTTAHASASWIKHSKGIGLEINTGDHSSNTYDSQFVNHGSLATGNAYRYMFNGVDKAWLNNAGEWTAQKFVKQGGTSAQFLMADGSTSGGSKKYKALISQTATGAPTAIVLENTLGGTLVWTRTGTGTYSGTLSGAFDQNKTLSTLQAGITGDTFARVWCADANTINVVTSSSGAPADSFLFKSTLIIEVYP